MDRFSFHFIALSLALFIVNSEASIIVANDWASALVQVRDNKGVVIQVSTAPEGAANFHIEESQVGGVVSAKINPSLYPGALLNARVVTSDGYAEDDGYTDVEGWLKTSWTFSVIDDSTDFLIELFADEGGDFFSSYSLFDLTINSSIFSNELYNYGYISDRGTLQVGHEYQFCASLSRMDMSEIDDFVADGTTGLDFWVGGDVTFSADRTHIQTQVPESKTVMFFLIGFLLLMAIHAGGKRKYGLHPSRI